MWVKVVRGCEYRFYDDLLDELYVSDQRQMQLIGIFAIVCILISCLGLFGLASFTTLAMAVAFVTVAIQSYKTARANPGEALRYEQ